MFSCHLLPVDDRIFFHVLECLVCLYRFTLCRYLFNLPSFVRSFWFILLLPFPFCSYISLRLFFVLLFWPVFVIFLFAFPVEFLILVLIFPSCFLRWSQFSHTLISLPRRLVHLIRLYYSLIYKVVLDSFYSFPS